MRDSSAVQVLPIRKLISTCIHELTGHDASIRQLIDKMPQDPYMEEVVIKLSKKIEEYTANAAVNQLVPAESIAQLITPAATEFVLKEIAKKYQNFSMFLSTARTAKDKQALQEDLGKIVEETLSNKENMLSINANVAPDKFSKNIFDTIKSKIDNINFDNLEVDNLEVDNLEVDNLEVDNLEVDNLEVYLNETIKNAIAYQVFPIIHKVYYKYINAFDTLMLNSILTKLIDVLTNHANLLLKNKSTYNKENQIQFIVELTNKFLEIENSVTEYLELINLYKKNSVVEEKKHCDSINKTLSAESGRYGYRPVNQGLSIFSNLHKSGLTISNTSLKLAQHNLTNDLDGSGVISKLHHLQNISSALGKAILGADALVVMQVPVTYAVAKYKNEPIPFNSFNNGKILLSTVALGLAIAGFCVPGYAAVLAITAATIAILGGIILIVDYYRHKKQLQADIITLNKNINNEIAKIANMLMSIDSLLRDLEKFQGQGQALDIDKMKLLINKLKAVQVQLDRSLNSVTEDLKQFYEKVRYYKSSFMGHQLAANQGVATVAGVGALVSGVIALSNPGTAITAALSVAGCATLFGFMSGPLVGRLTPEDPVVTAQKSLIERTNVLLEEIKPKPGLY